MNKPSKEGLIKIIESFDNKEGNAFTWEEVLRIINTKPFDIGVSSECPICGKERYNISYHNPQIGTSLNSKTNQNIHICENCHLQWVSGMRQLKLPPRYGNSETSLKRIEDIGEELEKKIEDTLISMGYNDPNKLGFYYYYCKIKRQILLDDYNIQWVYHVDFMYE